MTDGSVPFGQCLKRRSRVRRYENNAAVTSLLISSFWTNGKIKCLAMLSTVRQAISHTHRWQMAYFLKDSIENVGTRLVHVAL